MNKSTLVMTGIMVGVITYLAYLFMLNVQSKTTKQKNQEKAELVNFTKKISYKVEDIQIKVDALNNRVAKYTD